MFQGVLDSVALHLDDGAAERDLMAYVGAPEGTTYEEWARMRDSEIEPASWYRDDYDDCRLVEADVCFDLAACACLDDGCTPCA
jgi:hypothetical protein